MNRPDSPRLITPPTLLFTPHHGAPSRLPWRIVLGLLCLLGSLALGESGSAQEGESGDGGAVYVVRISGTIDLGLAPYLERVLDEAAEAGAAAVLVEVDTPGGRLDAVLQMKDALLASEVRTIAFVDRTAFSAGALVAIACETIFMAPGAVMGAATPVDAGSGDTASEKVVSAVRSTFRATAEARGRNPLVAEAMVDPEVEVPGLVEGGKLLTLTTTEAQSWGYADAVAATRAEVLAAVGLAGAPVVEPGLSLAERVVRFVTDPVLASLLIIVGLLLIVGDFLVEGVGLPALVGAGLIALFFFGHLLAGLAGWEDVALVVIGLLLIGVELFVIPGFGVAGVLGVVALLGGMYLSMVGREVRTPEVTQRAGWTVLATLAGLVLGLIAIVALLPRGSRFSGLVLRANVGDATPTATSTGVRKPGGWLRLFGGAAPLASDRPRPSGAGAPGTTPPRTLASRTGVALTDLRPSGTARIDGQRFDVVADGAFIPAGSPIVVVRDEGYRRVVARVARRE